MSYEQVPLNQIKCLQNINFWSSVKFCLETYWKIIIKESVFLERNTKSTRIEGEIETIATTNIITTQILLLLLLLAIFLPHTTTTSIVGKEQQKMNLVQEIFQPGLVSALTNTKEIRSHPIRPLLRRNSNCFCFTTYFSRSPLYVDVIWSSGLSKSSAQMRHCCIYS